MNGAQLIGSTSIDLESRLLSQEWIEMVPKPIERRYLWSPASLAPQVRRPLPTASCALTLECLPGCDAEPIRCS